MVPAGLFSHHFVGKQCLNIKLFNPVRTCRGKVIERGNIEASQEFFRCTEQQRPSGRLQPSQFGNKPVFHKLVYRMVTADSPYLLYLKLGDRLLISYYRQGLKH